jgi:hypothetical protein
LQASATNTTSPWTTVQSCTTISPGWLSYGFELRVESRRRPIQMKARQAHGMELAEPYRAVRFGGSRDLYSGHAVKWQEVGP